MAKKKSEIQPLQETVATVTNKAKELNEVALKNTDKAIDSTIKAGKEWQLLLAKSVKNGSKLASNQQDIIFDTLEGIKKQAIEGRKRWNKLFDFSLEFEFAPAETIAKLPGADLVKKVAKQVENQVETTKAIAKSVAKEATKTAQQAEEVVKATTKKTKTAAKKAAPAVKKVSKTVQTTAAATTVKVEKTLATKVGTIKTTGTTTVKNNEKDDLKKIDGIGPKIETLLNVAGIKTYAQLAAAKDEDLKAVLLEAGSRFKMHNPADWNEQAQKLAAAKK